MLLTLLLLWSRVHVVYRDSLHICPGQVRMAHFLSKNFQQNLQHREIWFLAGLASGSKVESWLPTDYLDLAGTWPGWYPIWTWLGPPSGPSWGTPIGTWPGGYPIPGWIPHWQI